jgi:hypothetical protein
MARIAIRSIDEAAPGPMPPGFALEGGEAFPVLSGGTVPIPLYRFSLDRGGTLQVYDAGGGTALYVRSGEVVVGDVAAVAGSSVIVEHRASATIAAREASELICFMIGEPNLDEITRAGGRIHVLPADSVPRCRDFDGQGRVGGALFADSNCPTCEMWLHETMLQPGGHETPVHSHDEDEVIVVIGGEIILGRRGYGPGTAIAIARDTMYGFRSGEQGLDFINFRPRSPVYVPANKSRAAIDERDFNLARMAAPEPITFDCPAAMAG